MCATPRLVPSVQLPALEARLETDYNLVTLHKLRALRRRARLKGVLTRTDPDMAQAGIPISPWSSKRSRSRDSAPSTLNSSRNTTPAVSTQSLAIPPSAPATPADGEPHPDATPYPAFLTSTRADLQATWDRLERTQMDRLRESAPAAGAEPQSRWVRCIGEDFAMRNRYVNVDPYQANRVRLEVPEGHFDYINASPVLLETTKSHAVLKYIATQGPKADSWSHIWRMIWSENSSPAVIVMLTQTHESGREKCYPYYPVSPSSPEMRINEHDEFDDGSIHNLHLASLSQHEEARTEVRELDMTTADGTESRKIWHLLFAGWPDFSVPEGADRTAMLKLVDMSRSKNGDNAANPRIVHCSAGIGRSGTFIALDWLMQELEEGALDDTPAAEDPILTVIERLRDQRAGMVQSKNQFFFIYDVLRERWRERWIHLHASEAARLGITPSAMSHDTQPALKRRKSTRDGDAMLLPDSDGDTMLLPDSDGSDATQSPDARARLEAELQDADMRHGI